MCKTRGFILRGFTFFMPVWYNKTNSMRFYGISLLAERFALQILRIKGETG